MWRGLTRRHARSEWGYLVQRPPGEREHRSVPQRGRLIGRRFRKGIWGRFRRRVPAREDTECSGLRRYRAEWQSCAQRSTRWNGVGRPHCRFSSSVGNRKRSLARQWKPPYRFGRDPCRRGSGRRSDQIEPPGGRPEWNDWRHRFHLCRCGCSRSSQR